MPPEWIPLLFAENGSWACLREITGFDEQSVDGIGILFAIDLLNRLLVDAPGASAVSGAAADLASADRDRLLAAIYIRTYGSRVESTLNCRQCEKPFDLDFSLKKLLGSLFGVEVGAEEVERKPGGVFHLPNGCRFRLPNGKDECAVLGMQSEVAELALLKRCVLEGESIKDKKMLQDNIQALAPLVDLDLDADCPECGAHQSIHLDIQHFLLSSLQLEKPRLAYEIHRLARAYGWRLHEILELPRSARRTHVSLVESELGV